MRTMDYKAYSPQEKPLRNPPASRILFLDENTYEIVLTSFLICHFLFLELLLNEIYSNRFH